MEIYYTPEKYYKPNIKPQRIISINTAFKQRCESGFYFNGEMHNFWELVYVTDGKITASEDNNVYELSRGNVIFHKPMEFHKLRVENGMHARIMVISFDASDNFYPELGNKIFKLTLQEQAELEKIYTLINNNFDIINITVKKKENNSILNEKITFMKLELFMLSLLAKNNNVYEKAELHTLSAINYKLIVDVMTENINHNLSMRDIARLCNFSVSNLKKTFEKYADGGVMKHFMRLKIRRAMDLLEMGFTSSQISVELGFSSQNYFSKVFKRETGMLPSEFKNKKQQ